MSDSEWVCNNGSVLSEWLNWWSMLKKSLFWYKGVQQLFQPKFKVERHQSAHLFLTHNLTLELIVWKCDFLIGTGWNALLCFDSVLTVSENKTERERRSQEKN